MKSKITLFCTATLLIALIIFGSIFAVSRANGEKKRYMDAERRLALIDLCDSLNEMEKALADGDTWALNRAAGRAEAYLSRAGLGDTPEAYRKIAMIASGECGADECIALTAAAQKALAGDGGAALSSLNSQENRESEISAETTEDMLASRMLERIGKGKDDVALTRAVAFACPNAVFKEAECGDGCFKYSGDNIFISVGGSNSRVLMYCFEREIDPNYSVSEEEAINIAGNVIKREKLKLRSAAHTELRDGIYRNIWFDDESGEPLVVVEIYSDTGRLRLYNASRYYENQN